MTGNLYIYCITESSSGDLSPGITGHLDAPVFVVSSGDFSACVSEVPFSSLEVTYEGLRRHEDVTAEVMRSHEVLPVSYSTVCTGVENVLLMLDKYAVQFRENLERIRGKVELGFKVFYKLNKESEEKNHSDIPRTDMSPKDYILKMYERYQKNQRLADVPLAAVNGFHGILSSIAAESSFTKPMKNNLVFNGSYLVKREDKSAFDRAVDDITIHNREYKIVYSGPWPAYHFIKTINED